SASVPRAAVQLPTELVILAATSGRIVKLIQAYAAASLRPRAGSANVSSQPIAPDFGTMNWMFGSWRLSVQPPVSHIIAATISPERMPLSSWSLLSKKNRTIDLQAESVAPTLSISAAYALGSPYSANGSLPDAKANAISTGLRSRSEVLPLRSARHRSG